MLPYCLFAKLSCANMAQKQANVLRRNLRGGQNMYRILIKYQYTKKGLLKGFLEFAISHTIHTVCTHLRAFYGLYGLDFRHSLRNVCLSIFRALILGFMWDPFAAVSVCVGGLLVTPPFLVVFSSSTVFAKELFKFITVIRMDIDFIFIIQDCDPCKFIIMVISISPIYWDSWSAVSAKSLQNSKAISIATNCPVSETPLLTWAKPMYSTKKEP